MKYLNLPKPHGFLIWRGKQTAIASPTKLATDEKMLVISDGEAFGEIVLKQPVAVNLDGFKELEDYHCIRPEDRKLYWPDADKFFVYRLKSWTPYEQWLDDGKRVLPARAIKMNGDEAELIDLPEPTEEQKRLLEQAERLPKTIILLDEAVTLEDGKAIPCGGVDCSKLEPILKVTLDGIKSSEPLPLYQLALVRIPRLMFKAHRQAPRPEPCREPQDERLGTKAQDEEKKSELPLTEDKAMPYSKVKRGDEWCVIKSDTEEVEKCYDNEGEADDYLAALKVNVEDEGKSVKELIAEARKCYAEGAPMPIIYGGPTTFADLEALEEARERQYQMEDLTSDFYVLSSNIFTSPEIEDKAAALSALAGEYGTLVKQVTDPSAVLRTGGAKSVEPELTEEDEKEGKRIKQSMKDKLKQAWQTLKELVDWAEPQEDTALDMLGKSVAVKSIDGEYWHFAWSTNAFEDRQNEIFSTKSLEKYVEQAEKQNNRGYFNLWHIGTKANPAYPALTDFAEIKWQGVVGRILVEAGPYLDNELGQAAKAFFTQYPDSHPEIAPDGWGSSPEYKYLPEERKTGVYENIWKTRTSTLPRTAAANFFTKGTIMALSSEQQKAAETIFGKDLASKIISSAEAATKELEEAGVAHKEVTTETVTETVVELSEDAVVEKVAKQIGIDFQPIAEALTKIAENQTKLETSLAEMGNRIKSLETTEEVKSNAETPRYVFGLVQRASEAQKTVVADDDDLKNKKPALTQPVQQSGAAAFFPARR